MDQLFKRLDQAIKDAGYLPMSGQIVDASLVAAPRQRNTEKEKAAIKAGKNAAESSCILRSGNSAERVAQHGRGPEHCRLSLIAWSIRPRLDRRGGRCPR